MYACTHSLFVTSLLNLFGGFFNSILPCPFPKRWTFPSHISPLLPSFPSCLQVQEFSESSALRHPPPHPAPPLSMCTRAFVCLSVCMCACTLSFPLQTSCAGWLSPWRRRPPTCWCTPACGSRLCLSWKRSRRKRESGWGPVRELNNIWNCAQLARSHG